MEWSKIKNIILLMLVTVNIFLLVLMVSRQVRSDRYTEDARQSAIEVLKQNGISADKDQIPWEKSLPPLTMSRDTEQEKSAAAALLGECTQSWQGGVYRYSGEKGTVQFSRSGEFSGTFSADAYPLNGTPMEDYALRCLSLIGFQGEVIGMVCQDDSVSVSVRQLYEGVPVFSCVATLVYENDCLISISDGSRRLTGTPKTAVGTQSLSMVTVLLRFLEGTNELGDVCTSLESITAGYTFTSGLADPITLTPTWHVSTDIGEYYLDGVTGKLERAK
ncbi:hypothetical protein SDC9_77550 [bioreactor metagenome]|uniref:Regulatory protein YycH-like domain-containing protein n=1 Tax=bioreactor metagenome TaxID=1076179 RepID=A0A644YRR8_9ZZZZ